MILRNIWVKIFSHVLVVLKTPSPKTCILKRIWIILKSRATMKLLVPSRSRPQSCPNLCCPSWWQTDRQTLLLSQGPQSHIYLNKVFPVLVTAQISFHMSDFPTFSALQQHWPSLGISQEEPLLTHLWNASMAGCNLPVHFFPKSQLIELIVAEFMVLYRLYLHAREIF